MLGQLCGARDLLQRQSDAGDGRALAEALRQVARRAADPHPTSSTVLGIFSAQPAQTSHLLHEVSLASAKSFTRISNVPRLAPGRRRCSTRGGCARPSSTPDLLLRPGVVLPAHRGHQGPGRVEVLLGPGVQTPPPGRPPPPSRPRKLGVAVPARPAAAARRGDVGVRGGDRDTHLGREAARARATGAGAARSRPTSSSVTFRRTSAPSARQPRRGVGRPGRPDAGHGTRASCGTSSSTRNGERVALASAGHAREASDRSSLTRDRRRA